VGLEEHSRAALQRQAVQEKAANARRQRSNLGLFVPHGVFSFSAVFADLDEDGWLDLLVVCDFGGCLLAASQVRVACVWCPQARRRCFGTTATDPSQREPAGQV
jgi:hypothetical protein